MQMPSMGEPSYQAPKADSEEVDSLVVSQALHRSVLD